MLTTEPFTPKPSQLSTEIPLTEGRSRRTAATKADKYIDIVSRRLLEVPANGSTPKSMKIASKLISEASPNTRRNILLSQTMKSKPSTQQVQSTPTTEKTQPSLPLATPASVKKRNRTAAIRQMFQTPLMSLASAATTNENFDKNSFGTFSPSNVKVAPSTISRSKLNQVHVPEEVVLKKPIQKVSPVKETLPKTKENAKKASPVKQSASPVKEVVTAVPVKAASPLKSSAKISSKKTSPSRRSPRTFELLKEPIANFMKPQMSSVSATPKAPVVEFVAPQSVLRSSKRPRKQAAFNDEHSLKVSPAIKKQAKLTDTSIFPTVSVNSQPQIKITPQTPAAIPIAPLPQSIAPPSTRVSNAPVIIVPPSATKLEESSSAEDLSNLSTSTRRAPLRVQPAKTPTRAKAVIPSLSDYSAAAKIAVIEVAKNTSNNYHNNMSNPIGSTPKVEPWTSKFMQKEAPVTKAALNMNVKPVDTSKISGFANATVPIVPKFPLNLSNISNITKTSIDHINVANIAENTSAISTTKSSTSVAPESPLTRAKRIDLENSSREEKLKTMMETKADKLKKAMGELKTVEEPKTNTTAPVMQNKAATNSAPVKQNNPTASASVSSKLPVKPKANTTVLPSPKIPSRLAEAFSGIDSELPPIDIGLVDDENILKNVLKGATTKEASAPNGFVNPKMKKQPVNVNNENKSVNNSVNPIATPNNSATQLHRTAVLNSAARKINANDTKTVAKQPPIVTSTTTNSTTTNVNLPSTPKPQVTKISIDSSSPFLPEIHSE